ncbi:MAG: S-layer protein, partial [Clostridia bacterium]|nr:S-layer protein [Clostridia bacterium]
LQLLGVDSGKPPLPRDIQADPVYIGRNSVTVPTTDLSSGTVEIPGNDLRLSFQKPLAWQSVTNWDAFRAQSYGPDDYTFHVVISTYMPDSTVDSQIGTIGFSATKNIYLPVKQKRVLVLGKKNFSEDPSDRTRLICTIPGDKLFYDYVADQSLSFENNADPSEDGIKGDYPAFLVPNTTYYLQIFTSRLKDNTDINNDVSGYNSGLADDLSSKLSYKSPVVSFTTWPLTELPVPMPNIQLGIDPKTNVDAATGNLTLSGISVSYDRVLTDVEWQRYTSVTSGRSIQYEVFLSRDASSDSSFRLVATDTAPYPEQADRLQRSVVVTNSGITLSNGKLEPILPNTVYYLKARASLVVNGVVIGRSADTAVKAITTPKIDSGSLDNLNRDPRSPSEFSIAADNNGQLQLSDAWVVLNWLHAEKDVTYEMMCTSTNVSPQAVSSDYAADPLNVGFLNTYNEFRNPSGDSKLALDVNSAALKSGVGLTVDANGRVLMPIRRDYLRPNRTYYFSLRAVRNRGMTDPQGHSIQTVSRWITIPVTTRMVKAPGFLESVKDLEVGFNIQCPALGATADSMEVYLKKAGTADTQYVKLTRSQYSAVKDGTTYYFRMYNLEANQWYDIRVKNRTDGRWYDRSTTAWNATAGSPVQAKTRDPLKEIEVRWEGQDPYTYFLEARTDNDADYQKLVYNPSNFTDYGYDLPTGGRIMFYLEKTNLYVQDGTPYYVYYAKISGKPVLNADGTTSDLPLKSNTNYYVKLWAYNLEDSLHIGPAMARTDFSQADYDKEQEQKDVIDLFNTQADGLTAKLYWLVDKKPGTALRAIVKDDQVSALLRVAREATVTVDLSDEQTNTTYYELLIPYKTLEAVQTYDSRLNFKLQGAEITLNRGSIDISALKSQAMANGAKEPMILLRIDRSTNVKTALPTGFTASSSAYNLQALMIGSRLSYSEINGIIYNVLKNSNAKGPFKYGILDRELSAVLKSMDSYSYKSHADLQDMVNTIIGNVETELSRYLKDVIDGGSGLAADFTVAKTITSFPGKIGVKLEYTYRNGLIMPYVNYTSAPGWKEPQGAKAYVLQYV